MKPVDVKSSTYIDSSKENNDKDPKFKIVDIVQISDYKNIFFQKVTLQIGPKKFVSSKKLKILSREHMLLMIVTAKICWNILRKRIAKKQIKKSLELKK